MQVVSEGPISLIALVSNNTVPMVVSGGYINWGVSPHLEVILNASVAKWLCTKLSIGSFEK